MSKIHNLVYDEQQKALCGEEVSLKTRELKDRIDYLNFELKSIIKEIKDVQNQYNEEEGKWDANAVTNY